MAFLTPYLFVDVLLALVVAIYAYFQWSFGYWKRKGLPYLEPSFPTGSLVDPLRKRQTIAMTMKQCYDQLKQRNLKHGGIFVFSKPIYYLVDPEIIKSVFSKDFNHFTDRGFYYNEEVDPLSAHIFNLSGQKWKSLRAKLTPTFTSGKLKGMFNTLLECGWPLREHVEKCAEGGVAIDIRKALACYTTDVIGSCAFGIECKSFAPEETPFLHYGRRVFEARSLKDVARTFATFSFPHLCARLRIRLFAPEVGDFFVKVVRETIEYREKNNVTRNDFLQLLMEIRNQEDGLTFEQIAAQCFVFFLGGFETSSTTMSWTLYQLSVNEEIQEKARKEVLAVLDRHGGKITYEGLHEMKYLEQIINETLRLYPVVPQLHRECTKDYVLPGTDKTINKGERVSISVFGLQRDPDNFPDPEVFDPERFSDENKRSIKQFTYLPFGEGPRICIGARFAMMQTKVGLAMLLRDFKFSVHEKTKTPLGFDKKYIILVADGGIWLKATKL